MYCSSYPRIVLRSGCRWRKPPNMADVISEGAADEALLGRDADSFMQDTDSRVSWRKSEATAIDLDAMANSRRTSQAASLATGAESPPRDATVDSPTYPPLALRAETAQSASGSASNLTAKPLPESKDSRFYQRAKLPPLPLPSTPAQETNSAMLQRELLRIRGDLNFERFLPRNGDLLLENHKLKVRLEKEAQEYEALRQTNVTSRTHSNKRIEEMTTQIRTIRTEDKRLRAEVEDLKTKIKKAQQDCDDYRLIVVSSEARELTSRQQRDALQLELDMKLEPLKVRVAELDVRIKQYEAKEAEHRRTKDELSIVRTELDTNTLLLNARDANHVRAIEGYEKRLTALQHKLERSVVQQSEDKVMSLRKENAKLKHQLVELELERDELMISLSPSRQARRLDGAADAAAVSSQRQAPQPSASADVSRPQSRALPTQQSSTSQGSDNGPSKSQHTNGNSTTPRLEPILTSSMSAFSLDSSDSRAGEQELTGKQAKGGEDLRTRRRAEHQSDKRRRGEEGQEPAAAWRIWQIQGLGIGCHGKGGVSRTRRA
ncbi:hypothetical protein MRB53_038921 [Persea americana]|nr:hypothetical protein MRB53_038921 [Persea americana]